MPKVPRPKTAPAPPGTSPPVQSPWGTAEGDEAGRDEVTVTELRDVAPTFVVTIGPEARYMIEEELNRSKFLLSESKETGGLLFGTVTEDRIEVTLATGPGPDFTPKINTVSLDPVTVLGPDEARAAGDLSVGSWHAHPKPHLLRAADPQPRRLRLLGPRARSQPA